MSQVDCGGVKSCTSEARSFPTQELMKIVSVNPDLKKHFGIFWILGTMYAVNLLKPGKHGGTAMVYFHQSQNCR